MADEVMTLEEYRDAHARYVERWPPATAVANAIKTLDAAITERDTLRAELAAAKAEIARLQTAVDRWNRTSIPRGG